MPIKIGTRKSRLALAQTEMLIKTLKNRFPNVEIETVYISTMGDKTLDKPLATLGGKGVLIKELEMSLLSGETDVAVHSAKDLPTEIADGLEISAVLPRGSYGDVFVTRNDFEIKDGFVIGTGSLRRKLFAEKIYPNAKFKDIRGNVDTRLKKLLNGEYDALVLAKARGAIILLTNASHDDIKGMYLTQGFFVESVQHHSLISGKADKRRLQEELLISSHPFSDIKKERS